VSGFRDHFIDKYFGYRRRYVDHIVAEAPARARLANLSEIARLGFMIAGNVLCAAIFWLLVAGAFGRTGGIGAWVVVFALLALVPTTFALLALAGIARAFADRSRVQERVAAPANGPSR
jgi:ABC-type transport system involved in cytochrome bd biosynthesis fused ATPase/permease subunit